MRRDLVRLSEKVYDLLVVGGGIYGAWIARDAALRGLSVALIEKGDFGHATSYNTLRLIHGGLRYVQSGDIRRMRQSLCERTALMRVAPHLVRPLPFVIPAYGHLARGREALALALMINDLVGFDRNRLNDRQKHIPRGRLLARGECLELLPGIDDRGLSGGALFYDGQMHSSERLIISILRSAAEAGADLANYLELTAFLRKGARVLGAKAKDRLDGNELEIRAKVLVNASGPWFDNILSMLDGRREQRALLGKAMNIVVKRQLAPRYAVGVYSRRGAAENNGSVRSRLLFITPWRGCSLVGTAHIACDSGPDDFKITESDIQGFISDINRAYPAAAIGRDDVSFFYGGLVPIDAKDGATGEVRLSSRFRICDHRSEDGIEGLISVLGVKFTTARYVAEKTVDLVFRKLARRPPRSFTAHFPVYGGDIERFDDFLKSEISARAKQISAEAVEHLVTNYGSKYQEVLCCLDDCAGRSAMISDRRQLIEAEAIHAVRREMAQKLADVVMRRTDLGSTGYPGDACIETCARAMAGELGWSSIRVQSELQEVKDLYSPHLRPRAAWR